MEEITGIKHSRLSGFLKQAFRMSIILVIFTYIINGLQILPFYVPSFWINYIPLYSVALTAKCVLLGVWWISLYRKALRIRSEDKSHRILSVFLVLIFTNICCMIGLKHAIKIKEKNPDVDITICYIDIRAVGSNYEYFYKKARDLGIKFVRGRPAGVETDGTDLYIHVEDSQADALLILKADVVALSMAMVSSPGVKYLAEKLKVNVDETGFFAGLYAKFRTSETNQAGIFVAGTALSPADIPTTITRAAHAASHLDLILAKGMVQKRFPTAEIDNDKCTLCEICVAACPFGAIEVFPIENPGVKMEVNTATCLGCGLCVSSCPAACININYYTEDEILAQVQGLLYDIGDTPDPIIITFACWECAYASTDYIGQGALTQKEFLYPHNVRILPVQCTGNVSARLIQKTFDLGADGIIVLGCYEDKCHYESG